MRERADGARRGRGRVARRGWAGVAVLLASVACDDVGSDAPSDRGDAIPGASASVAERASRRPICPDADPDRRAFFGDLHVHTAISSDAWLFDVRARPDDAYRYGFGGEVKLPPLDAEGEPTRVHANPRPLDFMAVTDHAEFLGELAICSTPGREGADSAFCEELRSAEGRAPSLLRRIFSPFPSRDEATCGEDGLRCAQAARSLWRETQNAAQRWNVPCRQTTFVAYEYSSHRLGSNLHRNVIFRNAIVPTTPISYLEATRDFELWEALARTCLDAGNGCDVLAIPHNSNISNGRMFSTNDPGLWTRASKAARARLRRRIEPLVEIMQHKGDSECRNGLPGVQGGVDELCDFEKLTDAILRGEDGTLEPKSCYEGPGADWWPHRGPDCLSRQSYVRTALIEGLRQEAEIGVNPFKLGLMASTDTHNAIAGAVSERDYPGHLGIGDDEATERTSTRADVAGNIHNNPGGLIGVWAEENTRDALFDAMRRREVFGTSGPRMTVRFFGAWALDPDLCAARSRVSRADATAIAMGGDLATRPGSATAPVFLVMGQADPGTRDAPGTPLERLQVVKGWIGEEGDPHQAVYDVAGTPGSGARVDLETCEPIGAGHRDLCAVWSDPDFDPARRAVYYVRAVENPSCRYSQRQCLALPPESRPEGCAHRHVSRTIQERAWSSPIWYTPDA